MAFYCSICPVVFGFRRNLDTQVFSYLYNLNENISNFHSDCMFPWHNFLFVVEGLGGQHLVQNNI